MSGLTTELHKEEHLPRDSGGMKQRVTASRERLQQSHGYASLQASQPCPYDTLEKDKPAHGGECTTCIADSSGATKSHALERNDEAKAEALALYKEVKSLKTFNPGGKPEVGPNVLDKKGNMFGVLLCVDRNGKTQVLKAFSGTLNETGMPGAPGYCPMIPTNDPGKGDRLVGQLKQTKAKLDSGKEQLEEQKKKYAEFEKNVNDDIRMKGIQAEIETCRKKIKDDKDVRSDNKKAFNKKTEEEKRALLSGTVDDGKLLDPEGIRAQKQKIKDLEVNLEAMSATIREELGATPLFDSIGEKEKEVKNLEKEVEQADAEMTAHFKENRVVTNFAGETKVLKDCCNPPATAKEPQTGYCAAAKLLAQAQKMGLTPVSIAEFWIGKSITKPNKSGPPEILQKEFNEGEQNFVDSCKYCRSFLGFALHGLGTAQQKSREALAKDEMKLQHDDESEKLRANQREESDKLAKSQKEAVDLITSRHKQEAEEFDRDTTGEASTKIKRQVELWSRQAKELSGVWREQADESVKLWSRQAHDSTQMTVRHIDEIKKLKTS